MKTPKKTSAPLSALENLIHAEIRERGPMTFERFMELALYHPEWGYYARPESSGQVGRNGDFYTSVSVGPLFGRLLARQFAQWWKAMGKPAPFHLVECGGLDGQLAHDVLTALENDSPSCARVARYTLVEPLPHLVQRQKKMLANFSAVDWAGSLKQLIPQEGVLFGNELLDSFPVHRLVFCKTAGKKWAECCVTLKKNRLTWTQRPWPSSTSLSLPDQARGITEHSPQAVQWLKEAAGILKRGRILLLDYGWTDEEYFQAERPEGTLRAYRKHGVTADLLAGPGEQDLTAHVRWTPLLEKAERLRLQVKEFIQQGRWLTRIVAENRILLNPREIRQFHALTHPEIMGEPFRVLVLNKG